MEHYTSVKSSSFKYLWPWMQKLMASCDPLLQVVAAVVVVVAVVVLVFSLYETGRKQSCCWQVTACLKLIKYVVYVHTIYIYTGV